MGRPDDLNEERMRVVAARLGQQPFVDQVDVFPREKPDRVVAFLHASQYPDPVSTVRLELRLRLSGEFNLQYIEAWNGQRWECRWDRHENPHNDTDHFHPPPDIAATTAVDASFPRDLNGVIQNALAFIDDRRAALWDTVEDPVYPGEYEYDWEYGPEIRASDQS